MEELEILSVELLPPNSSVVVRSRCDSYPPLLASVCCCSRYIKKPCNLVWLEFVTQDVEQLLP